MKRVLLYSIMEVCGHLWTFCTNPAGSWTIVPSSSISVSKVGATMELSIPFSNITNPTGIYVCGFLIDERPLAELSLASFPLLDVTCLLFEMIVLLHFD